MNKRGSTILIENVIFIILNLIFVSMLIAFIFTRSSSAGVLDEKYAKEIALALDAARPGMMITIYMNDAVKIAETNLGKNNLNNIVTISGNVVTVKLSPSASYSYSFFNNVSLQNHYFDTTKEAYIMYIGNYNG